MRVFGRGVRIGHNNNRKAAREFKRELSAAKESVYIVGGDPAGDAYLGAAEVIRDVTDANPELVIELAFYDGAAEPTELAELAREGRIRLYQLEQEPELHFRVMDPEGESPFVYIEKPHRPHQERRQFKVMEGASMTARSLERYFKTLRSSARSCCSI